MKIKLDGEYGTRGNPTVAVRVYGADGGDYPIHGAILEETGWISHGWHVTGKSPGWSGQDLVPLETPKRSGTVTRWVNVFASGTTRTYRSLRNANLEGEGRIACVGMTVDWEEGQFDE